MGNERINPFITGQTQYPVKSKKEEKTEQAPAKEVVDVKAKPTVNQEQPVAKADSELVGAYFGFNATKGVTLDTDLAELLSEVLTDKELAGVKRYNATANENRIKAAVSDFESLVPVAAKEPDAFEQALASVNPKFTTPEIRARIANNMAEIEDQLNPFFG